MVAVPERELLDAVLDGDQEAFRRLVEPHRAQLHAHCYRMLGSVHDAEDVLQDVLLRAWRSMPRFELGRPLRPWLYAIATNACLDVVARRPRRRLPTDGEPPDQVDSSLPRSIWVEPFPDTMIGLEEGYAAPEARYEQREAVELAFIAALQHLPGRQRAVLILREVLGFSAREVADSLGTTVASVNSALQRARQTVDERLPPRSQQVTLRALGDDAVRSLVGRFVDAFEAGDVDTILALLADDATFSMPPYTTWRRGRDAIADSWLVPSGPCPGLLYVPTRANGQLALGAYRLDPDSGTYLPIALDVLTIRGTTIAEVIAFRTPELFPVFGLPPEIRRNGGKTKDGETWCWRVPDGDRLSPSG